jgi:hypothetical protein
VGEFRVWGLKKAVHFIAILDFDAASDLASEMDGKLRRLTLSAGGNNAELWAKVGDGMRE